MSLEITATLVQKLDMQSGQGRNGPWNKQDFIIETPGNYPKKVCCTLWGDKTSMLDQVSENQKIKVYFDIESREYNGRWYTDVKVWKLEADQVPGGNVPGSGDSGNDAPPPDDSELPAFDDDDLPF